MTKQAQMEMQCSEALGSSLLTPVHEHEEEPARTASKFGEEEPHREELSASIC